MGNSPSIRLSLVIDPNSQSMGRSLDQAARQIEQRFNQVAANITRSFQTTAQKLQQTINQLNSSGGALNSSGSPAGGGGGIFGGISNSATNAQNSISKMASQIVKLGITIYSLKTISATAYNTLAKPWVELTKQITTATESSRKFEYAIAGVAGGLSRSRELNRAITIASRNSPLSVAELRASAESMASKPSLAVRLGMGGTQDQVQQVSQYSSIVGRLQTLFPEGGSANARMAITQAMQGDFQSAKRRLGLSQQLLAQLSGTSLEELHQDPTKSLIGFEKFADLFIPPESYARISGLVSTRWEKVTDAVKFALQQTGDSGIYDQIANQLKSVSDQMFDYFGSDEFQREARRMSTDLERTLAAVAKSGNLVLDKFTGRSNDISSVEGAVRSFGNVLDRLAGISEGLPVTIDKLGIAINIFSSKMSGFFGTVNSISQALKDPEGFARGTVSSVAQNRMGTNANDDTLELLKRAGVDTSRVGTSYYDTKVAANQEVMERFRSGEIGGPRAMVESFWAGIRSGTGANVSAIEELDFRKLPVDQAAMAQRAYMQMREQGQVDPKLFSQLKAVVAGRSFRQNGTLPPRGDENTTESLVRELVQMEYQAPNFQALLAGSAASASGLRDSAERSFGPLEKFGSMGSVFGKVSISRDSAVEFGEFLKLIDQQFSDAKNILEVAIREGDLSRNAEGMREGLNVLRDQRELLIDRYRVAMDMVTQQKMDDVQAFSDALGQAISDLPPEAKVSIQQAIIDGTTSAAKQFEAYFGIPTSRRKAYGIESMPIEGQRAAVDSLVKSNVDAIQRMHRYGDLTSLSPTATVQDITNLRRLSNDEVRSRAISYLRGPGMDEVGGVLNRAVAEFNNAPSETSLANVRAAQVALADLQAQINDLELGPVNEQFEQLASTIRNSFQGATSDFFHGIITGSMSAEEAFKRFALNIADSWARAMSDMAAQQITNLMFGQGFGQQQGAGLGGVFGGLLGLGGSLLGGLLGGPAAAAAGAPSNAVFQNGWSQNTLVHRAAGGPVFPGQSVIVGEKGPELLRMGSVPGMVIPNHELPKGGKTRGGSRDGDEIESLRPRVFVVSDYDSIFKLGFKKNRDQVIDVIMGSHRVQQAFHHASR